MNKQLTFSGMPLDRGSAQRKSAIWLEQQKHHDKTVFIPIWRGRFFLQQDQLFTFNIIASQDNTELFKRLRPDAEQLTFLGLAKNKEQAAYFAIDFSDLSETAVISLLQPVNKNILTLPDFRMALALLAPEQAATLSYAKSIVHWHQHSQYCGCCGARTQCHDGGHMRQCTNDNCSKQSFPRTDTVVIMLVEYQPETGPPVCLLANHHGSPDNLVSTLAGFVDPGETLEEAVMREVNEETSVPVTDVEYIASQPWPFPSSLMIGFFAQATSADITIDPAEISSANWYSAEQIRRFKNWGEEGDEIQIPRNESIARYLIDCWLVKQKD